MADQIPIPDPQELLPPLLACLPLSAFSSRPPPSLPPLLTPILRQRLHVLSSGSASEQSSWLPLLNWNRDEGAKLTTVLGEVSFEPHPVSGELEIEDPEEVQYRRLDSETLHARFKLEQFKLLATYLWCMADANNGGKYWRLSELKYLHGNENDESWSKTMEAAESSFKERVKKPSAPTTNGLTPNGVADKKTVTDEDDDDAYWAAYDRDPGRTPAKTYPAPSSLRQNLFQRVSSSNELEYFNRYGSEVQPAMDPYDPSEDVAADSTLNHHSREFVDVSKEHNGNGMMESNGAIDVQHPAELVISVPDTPFHPRPLSSSSKSSVDKLEKQAEHEAQAEIGIKQHISTDIKSLYRLARSAGISREEFDRIVHTELELLPLMDLE
jgi:hypothetical protein